MIFNFAVRFLPTFFWCLRFTSVIGVPAQFKYTNFLSWKSFCFFVFFCYFFFYFLRLDFESILKVFSPSHCSHHFLISPSVHISNGTCKKSELVSFVLFLVTFLLSNQFQTIISTFSLFIDFKLSLILVYFPAKCLSI